MEVGIDSFIAAPPDRGGAAAMREFPDRISRVTFQMDIAGLSHAKTMQSIEWIGSRVAPALREAWRPQRALRVRAEEVRRYVRRGCGSVQRKLGVTSGVAAGPCRGSAALREA